MTSQTGASISANAAISDAFARAKAQGRAALILYLTGAYPSAEAFPHIMRAAAEYADIIEVGIPFSDPLADGPVIQAASETVLASGVTTDDIFALVEKVRAEVHVPTAFMGYWNTVYHYGMEQYAACCQRSGVQAVILPDLPPEEAPPWLSVADFRGIDTIFLIAPTTSEERLRKVADVARGFVYCVSLTGVTGARDELPADLSEFIARARKLIDKPLAVGFGIATPAHVAQVAAIADGVIVGSALLKQIDPAATVDEQVAAVHAYLAPLKEATRI